MKKKPTYEELKRENEELRSQLIGKEQGSVFMRLIDNISTVVFFVKPETKRIVFANTAAIKYYGYSKSQLVGMNIARINGLTETELNRKVEQAGKKEQNYFVFKHKLASGEVRDVGVYQSKMNIDNELLFIVFVYDITERVQTENEIISNKNNFVILQQVAKMGSWELNLNTFIGKISPEFNLILDNPPDETSLPLDVFLATYIHKDDAYMIEQIIKDGLQNINTKDYYTDFEYRLITSKGKLKYMKFYAYLKPDGVAIGMSHDISERKLAEMELRKSEEKFRLLAEHTHNWEYWIGADGQYVYLSPACEQITGYKVEDFINDPKLLLKLVRHDYLSTVKNHVAKDEEKQKGNYKLEFPIIAKDGTEKWLEHYCHGVFDENGNYAGRHGNNSDITERRKATAEINKLFTAVAQSANTIVITDAEGVIEYVNPKFTQLTGFSTEEAIGQNPRILKADTQPEEFYTELWDTIVSGKVWSGEFHNKKKNGDLFWELATISPVKDTNGKITNYIAVKEDITAKKKAEQALHDSEERFKLLSNITVEGILVHEKGVAIDCNLSMARMFGYQREELLGKNLIQLLIPGEYHKTVYKYVTDDHAQPYIIKGRRKDGSLFDVEIEARYVKTDKNEFIRVSAFRDVTQRVRSQELLERSEARYRAVSELTSDYSYSFMVREDSSTRIEWLAGNITDICGYSIAEIAELGGWKYVVHPDDRALKEEQLKTVLDNKMKTAEYRIVTKAGTVKWVRHYERPVWGEKEKRVTNIEGALQDITKQKEAENNLKESQERLTTFMNVIPDIVCYKDGEGRWLLANDADLELFDLKGVDYYGKTDAELADYTNAIYKESFLNCIESDNATWGKMTLSQGTEVIPTVDGSEKVYDVFKIPIFNEDGSRKGLAVIGRDITDLKKIQDNLTHAKEKAEESARLKSAFLANMSHEIRTPMNGIMGFADLLKDSKLSTGQQKEYIGIIEKSGVRMLNIINNLINISMIESGSMETNPIVCDVNEQMEDLYAFFQPEAERRNLQISFVNSLSGGRAIIKTDREKLFAVLTNLIKNALKFTHKGEIKFGYNKKGQTLEFFVKDTGIGIPDNRQEAIFDRFIQADIEDQNVYEGAGLGLAISRAYVKMLNGKIWVESEEGKGSAFYFTIPYNSEFVADGHENQKSALLPHMKKKLKVLIAEDDVYADTFLSIVLKGISTEILHANTGKSAVEMCKNNPDLDLIMMDIKMPEMGGYEATRQIRGFNKDVVIIAQTAYAMEGDRQKAIEAGCNNYVSKPIDVDELMKTIYNTIKSQS
jgi:PAS domain S-box-containing protein